MRGIPENVCIALGVAFAAALGACAGFALVFYGYHSLHPPGPSGTEFEAASTLAFVLGMPFGLALGSTAGYLPVQRCQKTR
jgi:hypothetical protein